MKKISKENIIELIKYIIFGGLTTVVSLVSFKLFDFLLGEKLYLVSNIISWVLAVAFAFVTNKLWVFRSKSWQSKVVLKEALGFAGARLFSLGVEEVGLWLLISVLGMGQMQAWVLFGFTINGNLIAKVIMQVIVVIMNYVFSKFIIFKKKKEKQ
ncbi:MAG: GtrA family protein [Clostridia bacterium]|nr:GtrA family protein [Clostridia bacterium]